MSTLTAHTTIHVSITTDDWTGRFEVPGEPHGPYLAVTPALTGVSGEIRYTGYWAVTHRPTGRQVGYQMCLTCARQLAAAVADVPLDWGILGTDPTANSAHELAAQVLSMTQTAVLSCYGFTCADAAVTT